MPICSASTDSACASWGSYRKKICQLEIIPDASHSKKHCLSYESRVNGCDDDDISCEISS